MAYNNYAYQGYGAYYQGQAQDQSQTQSPATHTGQSYQTSSNPYHQYGQYTSANQYVAHQPGDRAAHQQYSTNKSVEATPAFQSSYYPQQQQYTSTTRNDNSTAYPGYTSGTQTSNAGYAYNTQSTLDQNSKVFQDNSALGNLAYASTLGARSTSAISNTTPSQQLYQQQQQSQQQQAQQAQQAQQSGQQSQQSQAQSSSNILPNPTSQQQAYGQSASQKTQATPQIPQQSLYNRGHVNHQQRSTPTSAQIRRSPSLPVKQGSISQQSTSKVSPHASVMGMGSMGSSHRPTAQSSNAHQISTIMNQSQDLTTSKASQPAPSAVMHPHSHNPIGVETRSPANALQSPAMTEMQQPTTIDPNSVFNHEEWIRRRKAQEDAETAKRMKEHKAPVPIQAAPSAGIQPSQTLIQPSQTMIQPSHTMLQQIPPPIQTPKISTPDALKNIRRETITEDEIRTEMKAFAAKLRTWKSQDNSATIDEMWRQTIGTRIGSTPQMGRSSLGGRSIGNIDTSGIPGDFDDPALGSPFQIDGSDLPDLGKFPAMRRRTRADKGVSRSAKAGQVAAARAITQSSSPATILPFGSGAVTGLAAAGAPLDAGAESMRRAMQAFHQTPTPATPDPVTPVAASEPKVKAHITVWPEDKKQELAQAAKEFLEEQPANEGKEISTENLVIMLNQNPSYDQLCMMIATIGFSVPRAAFAQVLLAIVPSSSSKSAAPNTATPVAAEETPAKKPRGRPKKNSIATPIDTPLSAQPTNGGPVKWGSNLTQANMPGVDPKGADFPIGDDTGYASFYEKMRLINGQSPAQATTPLQLQGKKRNIGELGKGPEINGGSAGKKQQTDRPGAVRNQQVTKSR